MGYLKSYIDFPIPIYTYCPKPSQSELPPYLGYCCREYINTLGSCENPTYQKIADYDLFKDSNCMSYLNNNFNYGGCFLNYHEDSDFLRNEWHIYLGRVEKEIMAPEIDTIYVRDQNGLLVNEYSYGSRSRCE